MFTSFGHVLEKHIMLKLWLKKSKTVSNLESVFFFCTSIFSCTMESDCFKNKLTFVLNCSGKRYFLNKQ